MEKADIDCGCVSFQEEVDMQGTSDSELIENYKNIAYSLANRTYRAWKMSNNPMISQEDLESEALLALVCARDNFDFHSDVKFGTYAYSCIKNSLLKYINRTCPIVTMNEQSSSTGDILAINNAIGVVFIDQDYNHRESDAITIHDSLVGEKDVKSEYIMSADISKVLGRFIESKRDVNIFMASVLSNLTREEIADRFSMTPQSVSRIVSRVKRECTKHTELKRILR